LRAVLLLCTFLMVAMHPGQANELRISGTAGYLSEWEFKGELIETTSGGTKQFSGPLVGKHVGLCVQGPQEKTGVINLRMLGSGRPARIRATLSMEGTQCELDARLSEG